MSMTPTIPYNKKAEKNDKNPLNFSYNIYIIYFSFYC